MHRHINPATPRRVPDGVFHQILEQGFEIVPLNENHRPPLPYDPQINLFGLRQWHQIFQHLPQNRL